jgi:uncharacterized cupredoxin-like copper-binding protein
MRLRLIALGLGVAGMVSFGAFAAGCGSDDETSSTSPAVASDEASGEAEEAEESEAATDAAGTTTDGAAGGEVLSIDMGEFYYKPKDAQAKAGTLTIDAKNVGSAPHELVLAKTDLAPDKLPTSSDGSVDEESLDVPGEVSEIPGGADGSVSVDLQPGSYVMFCNLPGHYASGMYGSLTVK